MGTRGTFTLAESHGAIGLNILRRYGMTFRFAAGELRLKPLGTVQEVNGLWFPQGQMRVSALRQYCRGQC